mgnify:CR=1 FL=1
MCCGDGGSEVQRVESVTTNNIPPYVEKGGEQLFEAGKTLATRPYPIYPAERIADFSPDTTKSFEMVRDASGVWKPAFDKATASLDRGSSPVGTADIAAYMNPYSDDVIKSTIDNITRQATRDKIARHASYANRGSYLNEDRREALDILREDATQRAIAETTAKLRSQAFGEAVAQGNVQKNRDMNAATAFTGEGAARMQAALADAAARAGIGTTQEAKTQANLDLGYQDFLRQFGYSQEQLNWLAGLLRGVPYSTSQTKSGDQIIPTPNNFTANLGAFGLLAGGLGNMGVTPQTFGLS